MPCHHPLAAALHAYIETAEIAEQKKVPLFRTACGRPGKGLSDQATGVRACRCTTRRRTTPGISEMVPGVPACQPDFRMRISFVSVPGRAGASHRLGDQL